MCWLELLKNHLVMSTSTLDFAFRNFFAQLCDGRKKLLFIGSFKVLYLLPVIKGDEVWYSVDLECHCAVSGFRSVDSDEQKIRIIIGFCCSFECRFNSHTRWTRRRPKVNNDARRLLDDLLQLCVVTSMEDLTNFRLSLSWSLLLLTA